MKKIINALKKAFYELLEKELSLKIISLAAAVAIWFIVSINVYPTIEKPIYNVPVVIETSGTYAEAHNFRVSGQKITEANVYISGDRGQIGNLDNSQLTIVASAENVMSEGEFNLPLEVQCSNGSEFDVIKIYDSENETLSHITVTFDEIITKTIEVKPDLDDIHIASGHICDEEEVVIVPESIEITGPRDKVSAIDTAYVNINTSEELSSTYEYSTNNVKLYSGSTPIATEEEEISMSRTDFTVRIPILMKQTLPLEVNIINTPESFDTNAFIDKLKFSVSELEVAVPSENARNIAALNIGSIDMRAVDIGSVFVFNTEDFLPEGYQDLSNTNTVTVECPTEGLAKVMVVINKNAVQFVNAPAQFDYKIITSGFTMYFIGSEESIKQLSYIDVVSNIDLINYDLEERDYKFPVTFSTPSYDDVWSIGSDGELSPRATVTVTLKSTERS